MPGSLDIKIDGDHILEAYDTLKTDLGALITDDPDRRVEFVMGNQSDMHWRNLGTHNYAGAWVRGANPSEDLLPGYAIGAAVESVGGGAGAALAFYCDLPAQGALAQTVIMIVFGYCPKTASNRVEGYIYILPTVMARALEANAHVWVKDMCDDLEDLGGSLQSWTGLVSIDANTDIAVKANYSGGNDGLVEITVSKITRN